MSIVQGQQAQMQHWTMDIGLYPVAHIWLLGRAVGGKAMGGWRTKHGSILDFGTGIGRSRTPIQNRGAENRRLRTAAALMTAVGLLAPMLLAQPARSAPAADVVPPPPLHLISRGIPAYASSTRG